MDMLAVDMSLENSIFVGDHMLTAHVHERDRFMPSLGISQELMGQQTFYIKYDHYRYK